METLTLSPDLYRRMLDHAQAALPDEAVGLLGGHPPGRVTRVIPLPNLAGPRAFLADPWSQFQAERTLKQAGLALLAIYHSHPGGGVQPSTLDRRFAAHLPVIQVIIALDRSHRPGETVQAYRLSQDQVVEVRVDVRSE